MAKDTTPPTEHEDDPQGAPDEDADLSPDERLEAAERLLIESDEEWMEDEEEEDEWIPWEDDEDFDLSKLKPRPSGLRLTLMIAVVAVSAYVFHSFYEEIAYYFKDEAPTDLGMAMDYRLALDSEGQYRRVRTLEGLPHNDYVRVSGLPVRLSLAPEEEKAFFQLEGARIFVEKSLAEMGEEAKEAEEGGDGSTWLNPIERTVFQGEGRLIAFAEDKGVYTQLRDFYREKYGMTFCSDLPASEIERRRAELGQGGLVAFGDPATLAFLEGASNTDASLYDASFPRDTNEGFAVGSGGTFLKTDNGGKGWQVLDTPDERNLYATAFTDDLLTGVLAGDAGALLLTDDGGRSFFQPYPYISQDLRSAHFFPGGKIGFVTGAEGIILGTRDGGKTWSPRPVLTNPDFHDLNRVPSGALIAVADDGLLLRSVDQGETWYQPPVQTTATLYDVSSRALASASDAPAPAPVEPTPPPADAPENAASPADAPADSTSVTVAVGGRATVLLSRDGGESWDSRRLEEAPGLSFRSSLLTAAISPNLQRMVFAGRDGALGLSRDGGESLQILSGNHSSRLLFNSILAGDHLLSGLRSAVHVASVKDDLRGASWLDDETVFIVGDGGALLVSRDGGVTWRHQRLYASGGARYLLRTLHQTLSFEALPHEFRTTFAGLPQLFGQLTALDWDRRRVPLDQPKDLHDVVFLDANRGFISGQTGTMLETRDAGQSWIIRDPGTIQSIYNMALISELDDPLILFSGYRGMWGTWRESTDTFARNPGPITDSDLEGIALPSLPAEGEPILPVVVGEDAQLLRVTAPGEVARPWRVQPRHLHTFSVARDPIPAGLDSSEEHVGVAVGAKGTMLRSVDGGYTFHFIPSGTTEALWAVSLSRDASVGYAGGENATLLRGSEAMRTWESVDLSAHASAGEDVRGVAVDPAAPDRVVITLGNRVLLSEDGAESFRVVHTASGPLSAMRFHPDSGTLVAAGAGGAVAISRDRGETWSATSAGGDDWNAVHLDPPRVALAGDGGAVALSEDGGASFKVVSTGATEALNGVVFKRDGSVGWAVGARGAVVKSTDGGATWSVEPRATERNLYDIYTRPEDDTFWVMGGDYAIFQSRDGDRWSVRTLHPKRLYDINFPRSPGGVGFAVGEGGTVLKTTDMGETWIPRVSRTEETLRGVVFEPSGQTGIAVGEGGAVITTKNEGEWWRPASATFPADFYAVALTPPGEGEPKVVFAGGGGAAMVAELDGLKNRRPIALPRQEDVRALTFLGGAENLIAIGGTREDPSTICEPGYVMQLGVTPDSHWTYLLLGIVLLIFGLYSLINFFRYLRMLAS